MYAGVQVKLWDPLRTRAIPERLRGVFTTRRYTNPRLPLPLPLLVNDAKITKNATAAPHGVRHGYYPLRIVFFADCVRIVWAPVSWYIVRFRAAESLDRWNLPPVQSSLSLFQTYNPGAGVTYLRQGGYVILGVCLFGCLLTTSRKGTDGIFI